MSFKDIQMTKILVPKRKWVHQRDVVGICDSQSRQSPSYCCDSDCADEEAAAPTAVTFSGDLKDI